MTGSLVLASRYHDFSCGHRVFGHENKCAHLHGHNYRVHFDVRGDLDSVGRVLDFSAIKEKLCMWLEREWDHRFLIWEEDPDAFKLFLIDPEVVLTSFNPTAENMALFLLHEVGPEVLRGTGVSLVRVEIEETRKCSATAELL